jgi:hypothetical protein
MPTDLKSGSVNLMEPSGTIKVCNGIALPLPIQLYEHLAVADGLFLYLYYYNYNVMNRLGRGGRRRKFLLIFVDPCIVDYSVEIPTSCSFVIEFIIPKFIEGRICFKRHTAHHQEL